MSFDLRVAVDTKADARWLRRRLAKLDEVLSLGSLRQIWRRPKAPRRAEIGIGGRVLPPSPFLRLLSFKLGDIQIIKGTEDEGINVEVGDVSVISGGTGSVTVELGDVTV